MIMDNYMYLMKVYKDSREWVVSIDELSDPDVFGIEIESHNGERYHLVFSVYTQRFFHNDVYYKCNKKFHFSTLEQIEDICRYLNSPL